MNQSVKFPDPVRRTGTLKDIVNTPFKKAMFAVQLVSYLLIAGAPFIGGAIGRSADLNIKQTGAVIFGIFLAGEILFYGSLAFLGKELILFLKDKFKGWFRRNKSHSES